MKSLILLLAVSFIGGNAMAWDVTRFKKPTEAELKRRLTPEQFKVTQHEGTEAPFRNAYDGNKRAGIYVDIVSGEPLFSSLDKFDSGTGWPSFGRTLRPESVTLNRNYSLESISC